MSKYVIRGAEQGYDRLQVLSRSRWPYTVRLLERAGLTPGMRCLDVGCGSGAVTLELGRWVGPEGRAVGLDMDEVKLKLASKEAASAGLANVAFRVQDLTAADEFGSFDVVYCRFVLQHLEDPVDLLVRMWQAVDVGGVLVVEEADFDGWFCDPPNNGFDFFLRTYGAALASRNGDATYGRKLAAGFSKAGIPDPEIELSAELLTGEMKTMALVTLDLSSEAIVSQGIASEAEVDTALGDLRQYLNDPKSLIGGPRVFQVWSQRRGTD